MIDVHMDPLEMKPEVRIQNPTPEGSPRELAEETLQTLIVFTENLEFLSRGTGQAAGTTQFSEHFAKLIEGIELFADAITGVRQTLRMGVEPKIDILEQDMVSILKDLVLYQESGKSTYVAELLSTHLPSNLSEWRQQGIPWMIRSRDS